MKLNITVTYNSLPFCWDILSSLNFLLHVLSNLWLVPKLNKLLPPPNNTPVKIKNFILMPHVFCRFTI